MPGYKQELDRHEPTVVESKFEGSSLFDHLLHLWSVGELSATACQALGAAAHRDGLQHPAIIKLASLGAWGTCTNNISRDLKGLVARESKGTFPCSELAQSIPCRNPSTNSTEPADIHFFNAASVVASLFNSQEQFDAVMKPELVGTFWSNIKNDDPKLHILLKETSLTKADLPRVVPLWLHGDGVEYVDGRSLTVFSFGSLLNQGPSLPSSLLLFALPKDCQVAETNEQLWAHLLPGFENLQLGKMDDGTMIAGGFRFVIWSILGDQEHFCNYLKLPHWCTLYSCWECTLTGPEQMEPLGTSIKSNNMRTVDQEMNCRISSHALFTLPGVSHFNIAQDAMHILFCKGVFFPCHGQCFEALGVPLQVSWSQHTKGKIDLHLEQNQGCIQAVWYREQTCYFEGIYVHQH